MSLNLRCVVLLIMSNLNDKYKLPVHQSMNQRTWNHLRPRRQCDSTSTTDFLCFQITNWDISVQSAWCSQPGAVSLVQSAWCSPPGAVSLVQSATFLRVCSIVHEDCYLHVGCEEQRCSTDDGRFVLASLNSNVLWYCSYQNVLCWFLVIFNGKIQSENRLWIDLKNTHSKTFRLTC